VRILLLAALLLAPTAAAAVAFEAEFTDARGDVATGESLRVAYPRADIVRFSSRVEGERVVQIVEMAGIPAPPADSILVRSWFHDSVDGSFFVVDMEVRGDSSMIEHRFRPLVRRGSFYNVSAIDARWGVEGTTWVFDFDARSAQDASCFDPGVFSEHTPATGGPTGFDVAYLAGARRCQTAPEPYTPPPPVQVAVPSATPAPTLTDAPGSRAPAPESGAWLALGALAAGAFMLRRSARRS